MSSSCDFNIWELFDLICEQTTAGTKAAKLIYSLPDFDLPRRCTACVFLRCFPYARSFGSSNMTWTSSMWVFAVAEALISVRTASCTASCTASKLHRKLHSKLRSELHSDLQSRVARAFPWRKRWPKRSESHLVHRSLRRRERCSPPGSPLFS